MPNTKEANPLASWIRWVLLALAIGLLSFWLGCGLLSKLELAAIDTLFRMRGELDADDTVVIVAIDDASFTQTDMQWPWPRDYLAHIVSQIAAGDPDVIALDILFHEPSLAAADRALADAIRAAGNVVIINNITSETLAQGAFSLQQLNQIIPEIEESAAAVGLSNFPRDEDGTVRRVLAFQRHHDDLLFSWAMEVARVYLGEGAFNVVSGDKVFIGQHNVDLQDQYLFINYGGPTGSIPTYSAYQVANGMVSPAVFKDKIVLIGATSETLHDTYPTPYGSDPPMPGVEINAHAVNTLLGDRYIRHPGLLLHLILSLIAALIGMVVGLRLKALSGLLAVAGFQVVYGTLCVVAFSQFDTILPVIAPMMAAVVSYVAGTSVSLYLEQRARARLRSLFDRYVSPAAIDQMLGDPEGYTAEKRREMTILFSDIRDFTSLSEQLTPGEVVAILNEYLSVMTEVVFKYEGTIDKFEGDAILAFFNAPLDVEDHPTKAVLCAVEMLERLAEMQEKWAASGQHVLKMGVGINTGECFIGNIGSKRRMDYTVIGDTVNLASRLQDLTKKLETPILFSEATCTQLAKHVKTRFVGTEAVKGKVKPVNVHTVE